MIEALNNDIQKNISRIDVIKKLKEGDQILFETESLNRGNELNYTNQKTNEIQNEIYSESAHQELSEYLKKV